MTDSARPNPDRGPALAKPKLADVARTAGVSPATVSRVLSTPQLVRSGTRDRVLEAIRTLGYVPDGAARALASRRTSTVGTVVPTLTGAIFARATHALQTRLFEAGYHLLVACHDYDPAIETEVTRALIERGVDALVLVGCDHAPETFQLIEQFGVPVLLTWSVNCDGRHPALGFDNIAAARRVTRHLLDLGHRSFAVLSGETRHNDRARDRIEGVRRELEAAGLRLDDKRIIEQPFSLVGGRTGMRTLLALSPRPTAVVCGNDILAAGALLETQAQGLAVPGEVSITGFDDTDLASQLPPGITTVRVPQEEMGRRAAETLLRWLSTGTCPQREEIPVDLILRGSTGVAPGHQMQARPGRRGARIARGLG